MSFRVHNIKFFESRERVSDNNYPFDAPGYGLWLMLSGTRTAIANARQQQIGKYTHHNQAAALVTIWSMDGRATPGTISKGLYLKHHTVSELLTRLEQKGLIRKQRDEHTRNVVRLFITKKGRDYCKEVACADLIIRIMSALTHDEQQELHTMLQKLRDSANREIEAGEISETKGE